MSTKRNIQQRGNAFVVDMSKNGQRERVTCNTLDEAISVRARLEQSAGAVLKSNIWTLGQAVERCTEAVWKGKPGSTNAIRNAQYAIDFFGADSKLDEITTDWIDSWITRLKDGGNSNATVNKKLAALSKPMTFARQRGHMLTHPHMERQCEYDEERERRALTQPEEAQLLALLSQWEKDCHAEAVSVLVDTGLRPSELWQLEGRNVNLEQGLIMLWKTKTHTARSVPMTMRVKEILSRRMSLTPKGALFPFNNSWMRTAWDRAKHAMGLGNDVGFVPYSCRHTCASRLVQRGVHLGVVQMWLGHKTIAVTMRYAKQSPTNLMDAVKILEAC